MHRRCGSGSASGEASKSAARGRAGWTAALCAVLCLAAAGDTRGENWIFTTSAGATETYNHYIGEDQPGDGFVTSLSAALGIHGDGARLKLNGTVGGTEVFYAGQGQSNSFAPSVSLAGNLEAIENFFYVDATANISETFISPFGPQPANLTTPTNNRYIAQTYSVSPYIKGVIAPDISYSLRDDNIWAPSATYGNSSAKVPTTYLNNLNGQMSSGLGNWAGRRNTAARITTMACPPTGTSCRSRGSLFPTNSTPSSPPRVALATRVIASPWRPPSRAPFTASA